MTKQIIIDMFKNVRDDETRCLEFLQRDNVEFWKRDDDGRHDLKPAEIERLERSIAEFDRLIARYGE